MYQEKVIYEFDTTLATLRVYSDYCELEHKKNAMNLVVTSKYFAGKKKFYYSDLIGIQFREAGKITDGYLEFETPGNGTRVAGGAYNSENSISFAKVHTEQMRDIYNFIDGKIAECKRGARHGARSSSSADDLLGYAELLEKGIISQEEFNQKKEELLSGTAQKSDAQSILEARKIDEEQKKKERMIEEERKAEERKIEEERKKAEKAANEEIKRREKEKIRQIGIESKNRNKPLFSAYLIGIGIIYIISLILGISLSSDVGTVIASVIIFATFCHIPTTIFTFLSLNANAYYAGKIKTFKSITVILAILAILIYGIITIASFTMPDSGIVVGMCLCVTLMNILNLVMVNLIKHPKVEE